MPVQLRMNEMSIGRGGGVDIIRPRIKEAELENFLFSQSVHGLDERLSLSLSLLPEPRRERLRIGMWLVQENYVNCITWTQ